MMKNLKILLAVLILLSALPAYAQSGSNAYGGSAGDTILDKTGDWFATVGKSQEEKYRIKVERRAARKIKKAQKKIVKKKKDIAAQKKAFKK
jgi:hypothetical protein